MVKKFTIPFASQGDANDIPDALQVDGKVSFTQGFGYDYERPYDDPQAKDIAREDMNGLFKAITSAVGELQALGASEWSSAISYPKGAIVYFEKDLYISQIDDNQSKPPKSWVSITSIANDSLKKAANLSDLTNKTTARSNLGLGSSATLNKTDVLGTSTSLVATQKLVNDTKISLESSKQDKLTFTGTGNVARMSEVDKKRDINNNNFEGIVRIEGSSWQGGLSLINTSTSESVYGQRIDVYPEPTGYLHFYFGRGGSISDRNTVRMRNKDGTLALISDTLGYSQQWVDVSGIRALDTIYTNTTEKPIQVAALIDCGSRNARVRVMVDGIAVFLQEVQGSSPGGASTVSKALGVTAIVPSGSTYQYTATAIGSSGSGTISLEHSAELR